MDSARNIIASAVAAGRNLSELSKKIGKNHAYLHQFMNRGVPRKLPEDVRVALAAELGVPEVALKPNGNPRPMDLIRSPKLVPGGELVRDPDFPIYAATQGGKGHLIVTTDAIQTVRRPVILEGVKNAYGLLIMGESMIPAFRPGDFALVHPHLPPERDTDVILYRHDPFTGEAEAIIKHLIGWTERVWKLEQFNPAKTFTESRAQWPICHRVVGKYDRRR